MLILTEYLLIQTPIMMLWIDAKFTNYKLHGNGVSTMNIKSKTFTQACLN
jgi:hypothetical protein